MSAMQELYKKVAADGSLKAEFAGILEQYFDKPDILKERLLDFAKKAGYSVSLDEMQSFFAQLADSQRSELSEAELDAVAGGKSDADYNYIYKSLATLGGYCVGYSIARCF